jgi:hypothetical protein
MGIYWTYLELLVLFVGDNTIKGIVLLRGITHLMTSSHRMSWPKEKSTKKGQLFRCPLN